MSDSVDRVFAHALNTVKKLPRLGTTRPPAEARLQLYGLYKQSMEGDITGVMDRPVGSDEDAQAEQEKWDSWNSHRGLSRTEAKRRYITTLIDTMHRYASTTVDARELVSELEFVWDQVKSNSNPASDSSSNEYRALRPSLPGRFESNYDDTEEEDEHGQTLRVLSPVSDEQIADEENDDEVCDEEQDGQKLGGGSDDDDDEEEDDDDGNNQSARFTTSRHIPPNAGEETEDDEAQEFVDAHENSQVAANDIGPMFPAPSTNARQHTQPKPSSTPPTKDRGVVSSISAYLHQKRPNAATASGTTKKISTHSDPPSTLDAAWGRRIETAIINLNTSMTALRESLDLHNQASTSSSLLPLPLPSFHRRPSSPASKLFNTTRSGPNEGWASNLTVRNIIATLAGKAWRGCLAGLRHILLDAVMILGLWIFLRAKGWDADELAEATRKWIEMIRTFKVIKWVERLVGDGGTIRQGVERMHLSPSFSRVALGRRKT